MYACERDKKVENQRKTVEEVVGFGTGLLPGEQLTDGKESEVRRTILARCQPGLTTGIRQHWGLSRILL